MVKSNNSSFGKISTFFTINNVPFSNVNTLDAIVLLLFFNLFFLPVSIDLEYTPNPILFISAGSLFMDLKYTSCLDIKNEDAYNLTTYLQLPPWTATMTLNLLICIYRSLVFCNYK